MPKIVVSLSDAAEQGKVVAALHRKKYDVSTLSAMRATDNPAAIAEKLTREGADVAIMDYLAEDAASVKMLQAAASHARPPRFIFVLPVQTPVSHILMAVNEGAVAMLESPVNTDALGNYVERALNGPSRLRHEMEMENSKAAEFAGMEAEAKSLRVQVAANRKLIAYLLSTPVSVQQRSVLVVSDSAYQRDYLCKLLESHGFRVILAKNPGTGLQSALKERPRIVISDLEMEGKNGVEFCRDLKIVNKFVPCFFIICTANSEKIDVVMAPGNGVDGCVVKPSNEIGNQELLATAAMGLLL